ncbi:hypothetical protein GGD38_006017 [Chitinophagaceae bacterium OAS944]|nr:hypothetical protein [Chitinophagaceae bacterium OAS944]
MYVAALEMSAYLNLALPARLLVIAQHVHAYACMPTVNCLL